MVRLLSMPLRFMRSVRTKGTPSTGVYRSFSSLPMSARLGELLVARSFSGEQVLAVSVRRHMMRRGGLRQIPVDWMRATPHTLAIPVVSPV